MIEKDDVPENTETPENIEAPETTEVQETEAVSDPLKPMAIQVFYKSKPGDDSGGTIYLPSDDIATTNDALEKTISLNLKDSQEHADWAAAVEGGSKFSTVREVYTKPLHEENFVQEMKTENGDIRIYQGAFASSLGAEISADVAALRAMAKIGKGGRVSFPLLASGFWVEIDPPSEEQILELWGNLQDDKVELGRYTYGAIFSNTSFITEKRIFDLFLQLIHASSINFKGYEDKDLSKLIRTNDLHIIKTALMAAMYPKGHHFETACVANPESCKATYEGIVDISSMMVFGDDRLTAKQRRYMANRTPTSVSVETILSYQKELEIDWKKTYRHDETDIEFTLGFPTVHDYFEEGDDWISEMNSMLEDSLGKDVESGARSRFLSDRSKATYLRQYGHYCKVIDMGEAGKVSKKDAIRITLGALSASDSFRAFYMESITSHLELTALSICALPNYTCKSCGEEQLDSESEHQGLYNYYLPIDPLRLFYTVLGLDAIKILGRS